MNNNIPQFKFALREDVKDEKQFLPTRAEPNATGWDVKFCPEDRKPIIIKPFEYVKIPLGFRAFPEEGWWFELKPRSSSFAKKHLHFLYGTIDETYPEECLAAMQYIPDDKQMYKYLYNSYPSYQLDIEIKFGEAIAQIIPVERQNMNVIDTTNKEYDDLCKQRGATRSSGFGSSDIK